MSKFDKKAYLVQSMVHSDECKKDYFGEERHSIEMIYHTRLDLVLLCSHLSQLNSQVRNIFWILVIILFVLLLS